MKALNDIPINVRAVGITMTLAALVIALLAVAINASPAMADRPSTTQTPTPQPCGPGQADVSDTPDAIISEGHYGVFDGYWNSVDKTLQLNLCPPAVKHTMVTQRDNGDRGQRN